ncbi:hypothetical protein NPIL_466121, partial [Nephila pilipes]
FEQRGTSSPSQINDSKLWSYETLDSSTLSLDVEKSAIARVFIKVFYVNALLFMLRERERGPLHWKKQSDTCCRSSPRVSAPKFPLRESKCKTMDRLNLDESFNCGAPDLGHGIFSGFE